MASKLILFIHGLGGDGKTTWGDFPNLIKNDADLKDFDIDFFCYPTSLFSFPWSGKYPGILELADALKSQIDNRYSGMYKDIVLVCHSLGGLIARKYLVELIKQKLPNNIRGVILFAVPNTGAELAEVASNIPWKHNQLRQLCTNSDLIKMLAQDWFTSNADKVFHVKYIAAGRDTIVNKASAISYWGNMSYDVVIDKGHISVVKPKHNTDDSFVFLKNYILGLLMISGIGTSLKKYATPVCRSALDYVPPKNYAVIAFDLDGTLLRGYTFSWRLVWDYFRVDSAIWQKARETFMKSNRSYQDYQKWCDHDYKHLRNKGLRREHFKEITREVSQTKNLIDTLQTLRSEGFILAIISGGIDAFVEEKIPDADKIFDYICINRFHYDDQHIINGIEATPFDFNGKATALEAICNEYGITLEQAVFVGENTNDDVVLQKAGLGIAYPPHPDLLLAGNCSIMDDNLSAILKYVL